MQQYLLRSTTSSKKLDGSSLPMAKDLQRNNSVARRMEENTNLLSYEDLLHSVSHLVGNRVQGPTVSSCTWTQRSSTYVDIDDLYL